jgi:glycerol-3-phosphate acyltransferase PlsY
MSSWVPALVVAAYLMGSLPFGLWVVAALKGIDIREVGSGNIGATNVYRAAGKGAAVAVVLLDMAKGAVPVVAALFLSVPDWAVALTGLAAILGHSRSVFLKFTGGKSVATGIGTILAMSPLAGAVVLALWGGLFGITRTVSLASLVAAVSLPMVLYLLNQPVAYVIYGALAALYVMVRHRANIQRLLAGEEKRL